MLAERVAAIAVTGTALIGLILLLVYTCWKDFRQNMQDSAPREAREVLSGIITMNLSPERQQPLSFEMLSSFSVRRPSPPPIFLQYSKCNDPDELHIWHD
jgi:hypothetical protein